MEPPAGNRRAHAHGQRAIAREQALQFALGANGEVRFGVVDCLQNGGDFGPIGPALQRNRSLPDGR